MKLGTHLANWLLRGLFLPEPELNLTAETIAAFESAYRQMLEEPTDDPFGRESFYLKHEFLRYITRERQVLLHGSIHADLQELQPRKQTDWSGKWIQAVFASRDGIWPIFFAILDSRNYRGSIRNGCYVIGEGQISEKRYYFFSLESEYRGRYPFREGWVYLLPGATFTETSQGFVRFDEWASHEAVQPMSRLKVAPADFPFLSQVAWHKKNETMVLSWLKYKSRLGHHTTD